MWNSLVAGPVALMVMVSSFTTATLSPLWKVHFASSFAVPVPDVSTDAYIVSALAKVSVAALTFLWAPTALPTVTDVTATGAGAAGAAGAGAGAVLTGGGA